MASGLVTLEIAAVFGLIALALVLFSLERMRIDATAVMIMTLLMLSGLLEPAEALSGFSNVATVTVGAMFVLSAGLRQTGALSAVGDRLGELGRRSRPLALGAMMLTVGAVSAFINNTAAVAMFIPVVVGLARDIETSPSKLLMPLSFASMFGGVSTLIGTSTNLLVSSIAAEEGVEGFSMFAFTPLGVALFVAGAAYLFAAVAFIPERRGGEGLDLTERFGIIPYLTELRLDADSPCVGETVGDNVLTRNLDVDILSVRRDGQLLPGTAAGLHLEEDDTVRVRAGAREIHQLLGLRGIRLVRPPTEEHLDEQIRSETETLIEAVISPDSQLGGQTVAEVNFPGRHSAQVLAVRHAGELHQHDLGEAVLRGGDSLLLRIDREQFAELQEQEDFVVVSEVSVPHVRRDRLIHALVIIAGVVGLAALDVLPIVVSAIAGCMAMIGAGCLTAEEAYDAINWKVIFLLAGVIPLGLAMEQTGAAQLVADVIVDNLRTLGPTAVLSGLFLTTQLLTGIISNNATAVLFAPIAIGVADSLGVAARPFLFAVTVAASMSFLTPVGYQTNTMIYGPGHYRFADFLRIGGPLSVVVWILATLLIPVIWPF